MNNEPEITVLSIGWGVQSWTLAAMCALGEYPKPNLVLHADTTWEHAHTYEFASEWTPWLAKHGMEVRTVSDSKAAKEIVTTRTRTHIPAFTLDDTTGSRGQLRRSCTHRWKIVPQRRAVRGELARRGLKTRPGIVRQLIGISMDEWTRIKTSDVKYIDLEFPLVEMRMTRKDCMAWLTAKGLPIPQKSSCVFCPYHSHYAWYQLRQAAGSDWKTACEVDEIVRNKRQGYTCYLTDKRKPLEELTFEDYEGEF